MKRTHSLSSQQDTGRIDQTLSQWLVAASQFYRVYGLAFQRFGHQMSSRSGWTGRILLLNDRELSVSLAQMHQQVKARLALIDQRSLSTTGFPPADWGVLPIQTRQLKVFTQQLLLMLARTQLPQA